MPQSVGLDAILLIRGDRAGGTVSADRPAVPFKSKAQRRKFAQLLVEGKIKDETYEEWNRSTGRKELPERIHPKKGEKPKKRTATKKTAAKRTAPKKTATKSKKRPSR